MSERTRPLATLKDLEAESGIDVTTLYRYCAPYGDLPCIRLTPGGTEKRRTRGAIRVRWTDWDAWLERRRVGSVAPTRAAAAVLDLPGALRYSSGRARTSETKTADATHTA